MKVFRNYKRRMHYGSRKPFTKCMQSQAALGRGTGILRRARQRRRWHPRRGGTRQSLLLRGRWWYHVFSGKPPPTSAQTKCKLQKTCLSRLGSEEVGEAQPGRTSVSLSESLECTKLMVSGAWFEAPTQCMAVWMPERPTW